MIDYVHLVEARFWKSLRNLLPNHWHFLPRPSSRKVSQFLQPLISDFSQVSEKDDEEKFHSTNNFVSREQHGKHRRTDLSLVIMRSPWTRMPFVI